jgi:hypothetical protein
MEPSRHFGPFSGAQLTIIIVVITFVVGFPFAAFAVTGSNTFVTDASTGARAKVDGSGQLGVADRPNTTTAYAKGHVNLNSCPGGQCPTLAKVSSAHALVITSIHLMVASVGNPGFTDDLAIERSSNGSCMVSSLEENTIQFVAPGGIGEIDLPYPSGLTIPAGRALCVYIYAGGSLGVNAGAYGYAVAPSAVPSS